ncbi:MAG: DUF2312 domain-containing protein [Alphaproteobacteria bacterium]|nr:DUF2312 domain-containing protein [Alphaproteobacteria bacterium]MBL6936924.1 DUF2312 domain-containing protein [Alphaproteobacteria bacterium]MBL7097693.1 DUF2312 domain-containing protein [Alphaproteobacteria bacterium]
MTGLEKTVAKSGFAKEHLRSFIERIERLEEEKKALSDDIKEVYSEAKGTGFDTKVMRQVIRLRKMESADRQEQEAMLDLYLSALGMKH